MVSFIGAALFLVSVDFGFLLVGASGAYPGLIRSDLGTRAAFGAAGAIVAAGIGILLGLSAELLLSLALMGAVFGALPHAAGELVRISLPGSTDVEFWLAAGMDTLFAAVYLVAVMQVLSRQWFLE